MDFIRKKIVLLQSARYKNTIIKGESGLNMRGSTSPNTSSYFSYSPGLTDPGANQVAVVTEAIYPMVLHPGCPFDAFPDGK